ncbi:MAG: glycosyltransferase [Desulfobacterota bacterium]|nr:glycosyltransferase [Thermodesulfobacteriota bacterium]
MEGTSSVNEKPYISVIVPVFNEEENLPELQERLMRSLSQVGKPFEILYVNDGSTDRTQEILESFHKRYPNVKVIEFLTNCGQHLAIMKGFEAAKGDIVITIDADLQNPPEEIKKLVQKMEEGYEIVATYRKDRKDSIFRKIPSYFASVITSYLTGVKLRDYGCMLRAYRRNIVEYVNMSSQASTFVPVLANTFAKKIAEIEVEHHERKRGKTKYSLFKLLRLNFDIMTNFSMFPIQFIGVMGVAIAAIGLLFAIFLFIRRLIVGPEVEGIFTLFAILFFFIGVQILALGVIGEYIGRIYMEVRKRPRYIVKKELL